MTELEPFKPEELLDELPEELPEEDVLFEPELPDDPDAVYRLPPIE